MALQQGELWYSVWCFQQQEFFFDVVEAHVTAEKILFPIFLSSSRSNDEEVNDRAFRPPWLKCSTINLFVIVTRTGQYRKQNSILSA